MNGMSKGSSGERRIGYGLFMCVFFFGMFCAAQAIFAAG
jgi:hypothetical protein